MVNGVKKYTTQKLHVGKNNEGYWTCEHMIKQGQEEVVAAFNEMHPGAKGYFTFDQSTNQAAFAPDALRASNMSLKPGGAQALLRPGRLLGGTTQSMVFEENHTRSGEAKGDVRMCCARHCMASQEDFRAQLSLLEETIIRADAKRYARRHCDYSFEGLTTCVPQSLDSSFEYDYELTRFAHTKYKSTDESQS
ncbi:hypothetical protein H257_17727 [Aphanomyces astaci]|uniref:Uncharacterized protein n=1 Tax=Aphanomyces astaci TaxID=112090 RepID=W4FFS1_APHAT|nr:hypothetical protein H257_17727 [Aphanomyces astaci]ETV65573.1 hypothetical protein H257_17727 [Aphanomyces astaci]|eukprot:XP_009844915.1 hypothetical protein H257_17727 [Aphanomyces astaci]